MATKKKPRAVVVREVLEEDERDPFKVALDEFGADAEGITLQIYRYDPMSGKPRYAKMVQFQKELHNLEWLQRFFGGGDYLLRFYDADGRSKNRAVEVEDPPGKRESEAPPPPAAKEDGLLELLKEQNKILLTSILAKGAAPIGGAAESPAMLKVIEGNQALNQTLLTHALTKSDVTGQLFSVFEKGVALAAESKLDSAGDGGGVWSVVRSIAKELAPALQEFARARATMPAAAPPSYSGFLPGAQPVGAGVRPGPGPGPGPSPGPSPGPGPEAPPTNPTPNPAPTNGEAVTTSIAPDSLPMPSATPEEVARQMVEGTIRYGAPLIAQAHLDREKPEEVAFWILGEVPANYHGHLAELSYDALVVLEPRYRTLERPWLEEVLERIRAEAKEPSEDDDASEPSEDGGER